MSNIAYLFIFCAIGAPMLGIGVWIGLTFAPSDIPDNAHNCEGCRRAIDHLTDPHRASARRGPFNKSTMKKGT